MCVYIYIYMCICAFIYIYVVCVCMHACTHACMREKEQTKMELAELAQRNSLCSPASPTLSIEEFVFLSSIHPPFRLAEITQLKRTQPLSRLNQKPPSSPEQAPLSTTRTPLLQPEPVFYNHALFKNTLSTTSVRPY